MQDSSDNGTVARDVARWALVGIFILSLMAALVWARAFFMPVILAFLLSLTFSPIRRALTRRGVPAGLVSAMIVGGLVAGLGAAIVGLSGPVQTYVNDAPTILREVEWKLRYLSQAVEKVAEASAEMEELAAGGDEGEEAPGASEVVVVEERSSSLLASIAASTPYLVAQALLALALLFFLISSGDLFYEKIVQASPTFSDKRRAVQIAYEIERTISRYFLTITVINAGLGISIGLVLWLLEMPNPALFGVMAFVLNFIPFLGAVTGTAVTLAIGMISYDFAGQAFLAAGAYLALTSFEGQLVTPWAVGRSLRLNPVVVFLAVAFWGWAWSVIGMIIAVPVLIVVRVFAAHVDRLAGLELFLSGRDEPIRDTEPEERPAK